jgi:hypothetical protein
MSKIAATTGQVTETDDEFLREAADRLRLRLSRTAQDIIEIGRELIAVKDRVGHGNFLPWIDREFAMTAKSAERLMSVAEKFGDKINIVSNLLPTVLYELAAPNTTEEVRTEIVDRAESGERISVADVQATKEKAKQRAYVAEHGTPELFAAVDRGEVLVSEAKAFVRNYPPSQQDARIMRSGSVADAVTQGNAAKAKKAGQTVAQDAPSLLPSLSEFARTDGSVKPACEFNAEDAADVAEPGDSDETIRHRIFLHHASEALRHASENGFDRASMQEIDGDVIAASSRAAEAWIGVTASLRRRAAAAITKTNRQNRREQ